MCLAEEYEKQVFGAIGIVRENAPGVCLDYFCKIWTNYWFGEHKSNSDYIAVLDSGVPELYIRASGAKPLFLLGGCFCTDKYAEQIFPQISDPVVKSACSLLFSKRLVHPQNLMALVVPVKNIDTRKVLPYLRDVGCPVITMEQDPVWESKSTIRFQSSQMNFVRKLYMLTNRKLTKKRIIAAAEQLTEARFALSRLDQTAIPEIAKSFIRQTYYIAPDIGEWAQAVDSVSCRHPKSIAENAPQVLLMGSPVYFLNTAAWN